MMVHHYAPDMRPRLLTTALLATLLLTPDVWAAEESVPTDTGSGWALTAKGGVTAFLTSSSHALPHVVHPSMRLEATCRLSTRLEMGVEVGTVPTSEAHYAFNSLNVVFRSPVYDGEIFDLRLGWGFGVGSAPRILSADLNTSAPIAPTMQLSAGVRWAVITDSMYLGLEVIGEQLMVATAVLTIGSTL